jgi:hypothetical protein
MAEGARPKGMFLIAVLFVVSICILVTVGAALLLPGSPVEVIWKLYSARRTELMPYRAWMGPGFLVLATVMLFASIGMFGYRRWGWWLAVTMFAANGLGDVVQVIIGRVLEGVIGVTVAGAILYYLTLPKVRGAFT